MNLPVKPKRLPRDRSVSFRMTELSLNNLKMLCKATNNTQIDVIEHLIQEAVLKTLPAEAKKKKP